MLFENVIVYHEDGIPQNFNLQNSLCTVI